MSKNPLQYLISFEGGAVALLATAFDKFSGIELSQRQLAFWAGFAKLCELPLSNSGPSVVKTEYDGADLIVVWDSWVILIEAKINDKFIRRGQLQKYYQKFRPQLGRDVILNSASSMAIVFLTPAFSQAAQQELDDLHVEDDRKLHLPWETVLSLLRNSFSTPQNEQQEEQTKFVSSLILQGVDRIEDLLKKDMTPGPMAVERTPERQRCRDFAKEVQNRVSSLWQEIHFNPVWSDKNVDEIYANFGGERAGNVYFDISSDSKIMQDDSGLSELHGKLYFKIAGRASPVYKNKFKSLNSQNLAAFFRENTVVVDSQALKVELTIEWSDSRPQLCERAAGLFSLCLIAFRSFME